MPDRIPKDIQEFLQECATHQGHSISERARLLLHEHRVVFRRNRCREELEHICTKSQEVEGDYLNHILADLLGWTNLAAGQDARLYGTNERGTPVLLVPQWSQDVRVIIGQCMDQDFVPKLTAQDFHRKDKKLRWLGEVEERSGKCLGNGRRRQSAGQGRDPATALARALGLMLIERGKS